ncbi:uncharacterized mitochondrial protein AtMg00810-like [Humulus lupulus]|uniref:uncharacterized mitochondrial protein AtMg00810-like n=1 Tax=Humulus lupulus TaxID=3486 RepID=UPI002B40BCB5|nr:uncharacterized mitochondrial protein AtMg00810-like [Humulus lupulus]
MTVGKPLSKSDGTAIENPTAPTTVHWNAVKRVLRYLKGTLYRGLHIKYPDRLALAGFFNADWACCPDDRQSLAGYCVYLGDTLLSWSSKKQAVVSRSSTESEYRALAQVSAELSWILGFKLYWMSLAFLYCVFL